MTGRLHIANGIDGHDSTFMCRASNIGLFEIISSRLAREQTASCPA